MLDRAGINIAQGMDIACERICSVNDNMTRSHYHDYFELYYLEQGQRFHMMNDDLYCLNPGDYIFFSPYIMHHSYGEDNVVFKRLLIYFKTTTIFDSQILNILLNKNGAFLSNHNSKKIHYLMNLILDEQEEKKDFNTE